VVFVLRLEQLDGIKDRGGLHQSRIEDLLVGVDHHVFDRRRGPQDGDVVAGRRHRG
jgi:hypothetical protein